MLPFGGGFLKGLFSTEPEAGSAEANLKRIQKGPENAYHDQTFPPRRQPAFQFKGSEMATSEYQAKGDDANFSKKMKYFSN